MSLRDLELSDLRPGMPGVQVSTSQGAGVWPVRIYRRGEQLRADVGPGGLDMACQHLIDVGWEFFVDDEPKVKAGF